MFDGLLQVSEAPPVKTWNSHELGSESRPDFISRMESEGFRVVTPKANELQIDIDSEDEYRTFLAALEIWCRNTGSTPEYDEHFSRSGRPRRHITMRMPFDMDPWQRIALQAAFGSDYRRELLSALRILKADPHPTLFVELKD